MWNSFEFECIFPSFNWYCFPISVTVMWMVVDISQSVFICFHYIGWFFKDFAGYFASFSISLLGQMSSCVFYVITVFAVGSVIGFYDFQKSSNSCLKCRWSGDDVMIVMFLSLKCSWDWPIFLAITDSIPFFWQLLFLETQYSILAGVWKCYIIHAYCMWNFYMYFHSFIIKYKVLYINLE